MVTENKSKAKTPASKKPAAAPKADVEAHVVVSKAVVDQRDALQKRRVVTGTVVSDKMQKTIVIQVDRRVRHVAYGKYINKSRRFKCHDEKNDAKIGDLVQVLESRPLSREKRWVLQNILRRAGQAPEANV